MSYTVIYEVISSELRVITVEHHLIFTGRREEAIALETLNRIPVKHKHKVTALEGEHLIVVFLP